MHAYVINLDRSPDRRAHIAAEFGKTGIDYEIVSGVDGRDLDLHDPRTIDPSSLEMSWFRPGVAGCALSHLSVYRTILADGLDRALVVEDDVTLSADLRTLVDALAPHLVGAEVALLNYDSNNTCLMSSRDAESLPSSRLLALPIDVYQPVSAAAYVITREACERMEKSILPMRAMADDWAFYFMEGILDRVRCVVPMPIIKNPEFGSTIDYHPQSSVRVRLREMAIRHEIRPFLDVIAYRRRRILRQHTRIELVDQPFVAKPSRLG